MLAEALIAGLGGPALTAVMATRREGRAARETPPEGRDVEVEGIRLQVEVRGPEAGPGGAPVPDLVLIHGASGNLRDMTHALAPALAGRYRVFVVDRPGLGWSDRHPDGAALATQARLIQQAVARLGARRPLVLGQSYGGAVALAWAATLPGTLAALVSVAGVAYPWNTPLSRYYRVLSHPLGQALAVPLITAWVPRRVIVAEIIKSFAPQRPPPGYVAHFGPELAVRRGVLRENARQRAALLGEIRALSPRWAAIEVPIELVHGDIDNVVDHDIHSARLAAENPRARLTTLAGIGHMPHHADPEAVIAAIDRAALRANVI